MSQTPRSPVPQDVSTELQRVVERWRQLPLHHALSYSGRVRALIQSFADEVALAHGDALCEVPHGEPATLMAQLTVMVYDASAAAAASPTQASTAQTSTALATAPLASTLAQDLASLRRGLVS